MFVLTPHTQSVLTTSPHPVCTYYFSAHLWPNLSNPKILPCQTKVLRLLAPPAVNKLLLCLKCSPFKALVRHFCSGPLSLNHTCIWVPGLCCIFNNHSNQTPSIHFLSPKPVETKLMPENADLAIQELTANSGVGIAVTGVFPRFLGIRVRASSQKKWNT